MENSECVVSRTAYRNNSSTYRINGKTCQFKDVAAYLGENGIDLDNNRFLILQGEVEMISMMAPKGKNENDEGLLEYLEDIIGSNKFVEETNRAMEQLEILTEQRQEKLNRVKAAQKELEGLESAKLEAQALLGKEREIRRKQNILYQMEIMTTQTDVEDCKKVLVDLNAQLEEKRQLFVQEIGRLKAIEKKMKPLQSEYEKAHAELVITKEEFASFERKDIKIREEIKHAKAEIKKLSAKVETETKNGVAAVAKSDEAKQSIPELEAKIETLSTAKTEEDAKLEKIFDDIKGVTQQLRSELEEKLQELAPINQEKSEFQNKLDTAETKVHLLEDSTLRAKSKLADAQEELATLDEKQIAKRSELTAAEHELEAAKGRIIDAQQEDKALADKENKLGGKLKDLTVSFSLLSSICLLAWTSTNTLQSFADPSRASQNKRPVEWVDSIETRAGRSQSSREERSTLEHRNLGASR